jgi:hypothetical protein
LFEAENLPHTFIYRRKSGLLSWEELVPGNNGPNEDDVECVVED